MIQENKIVKYFKLFITISVIINYIIQLLSRADRAQG